MNEGGGYRAQSASQGIARGAQTEVQDPLVLRRVGVTLLQHVVAPRKVPVEFASRAGGTRDDQPAVPLARQPQKDAGFSRRVVGETTLHLDTRDRLEDRGTVRRVGRDDGAIGLGG